MSRCMAIVIGAAIASLVAAGIGAFVVGNFLRQVIAEAVHHSRINDWTDAVPSKRLRNAFLGQAAALVAFVAICVALFPPSMPKAGIVAGNSPFLSAPKESDLPLIEPGDAEVERGSSLLVLARFLDL